MVQCTVRDQVEPADKGVSLGMNYNADMLRLDYNTVYLPLTMYEYICINAKAGTIQQSNSGFTGCKFMNFSSFPLPKFMNTSSVVVDNNI